MPGPGDGRSRSRSGAHREVLRVVLPYVVVAAAWIYTSDRTAGLFVHDPERFVFWSVLKGMAFVAVTGGLLWVLVARQMERQRRLEAQFLRAQKLECFGRLAGSVAHDYYNLLTATLLEIDALRRTPGLAPDMISGLEELQAIAERGAGLTRQMLLFSRREAAQARRVDLNGVVAGLVKMLRRLVGQPVAISFRSSPGPAWVDADPGMVEQVVMNLCVNARDAMPDGGELTMGIERLDVAAAGVRRLSPDARAGSFVRLRVADTGAGMDEETLRQAFEPFFTTKGPGEGTGLGLATVSAIVRQHRGWVTVASAPGCGSVFDIYLADAGTGAPEGDGDTVRPPTG
jgi:two-component system, cell cycle sensor histidine kinase and response regulator CckA